MRIWLVSLLLVVAISSGADSDPEINQAQWARTGQRATIKVRGSRDPNGEPYRKIFLPIESEAGQIQRRSENIPRHKRDFFDPDFGIKASINLKRAGGRRCKIDADADSEIPALGLDSGRMNVNCDIDPARVAQAAGRVARNYAQYRRERHHPRGSGSTRKKTKINIEREYERNPDNDDQEDPGNSSADADNDDEADDD